MSGLAWIEVTLVSGANVSVRIDDIKETVPEASGSTIKFRDGRLDMKVTQTAEAVGDLITAKWSALLTAITG